MSTKILPPNDTAPLKALFNAKYCTSAVQCAQTIAELSYLRHNWEPGQGDAVLQDTLKMRNYIAGQLEGRDSAQDLTALLLAAGKAAAGATGASAESLFELGQTVMSIPPISDVLKDRRSFLSAEATSDLINDFGTNIEREIDTMIDELPVTTSTPEFRATLGKLYPELLGAKQENLDLSAGSCVANHPETFPSVNITVQVDNSVLIKDIDKLRTEVTSEVSKVSDQVATGIEQIKPQLSTILDTQDELLVGQGSIIDMLKQEKIDASKKAQIEEQAKTAQAVLDAAWAAANGTVRGASAIASLIDPQLGKDVARVGGALVETAKTTERFVTAISGLSDGFSALSALGTAAATGNLIGAVLGLIGVFGPQEPSPELLMDQKILRAIDQVQQRLDELGTEMERGFARVDAELQAIYSVAIQGFSQVTALIGATYDQVVAARAQLVEQAAKLATIETSLSAAVRAVERADLYTAINSGLGYEVRNKEPIPAAEFNRYAGIIYTWATRTCFDEANVAVLGRPMELAQVDEELRSRAVSDNACYINALLGSLNVPTIQPVRPHLDTELGELPNPTIWSISCLALAQLYAESPTRADSQTARDWLTQAHQVGSDLTEAFGNAASDGQTVQALVDLYEQQIQHWAAQLDTLRAEFEANALPAAMSRTTGQRVVDIFAAPDQHISWAPPLHGITVLPDRSIDPAALVSAGLAIPEMIVASYLTPGSAPPLSLTYTTEIVSEAKWEHYEGYEDGHIVGHDVEVSPETSRMVVASSWVGRPFARVVGEETPTDVLKEAMGVLAWLPNWATIETGNDASLIAEAKATAAAALVSARTDFLTAARDASGASGDHTTTTLARRVDGILTLLDQFLTLVWPMVRHGDDVTRLLFNGPLPPTGARLLDHNAALDVFATGQTVPTPGDQAIADWATGIVHTSTTVLTKRLSQLVVTSTAGHAVAAYDEQGLGAGELVTAACARATLGLELVSLAAKMAHTEPSTQPALLKAMRTAEHGSKDQLVLEFDGTIGPCAISKSVKTTLNGYVEGAATTTTHGRYTGPTTLTPNLRLLKTVQIIGDATGKSLAFTASLSGDAECVISAMTSQSSLVLDIVSKAVKETDALLQAVRVGQHPGYDRVVLEFDQPPGPCSIDIANKTLHGKVERAVTQAVRGHYDGPSVVSAKMTLVTAVRIESGYSGQLDFSIDLTRAAKQKVHLLANPSRVVIDLST